MKTSIKKYFEEEYVDLLLKREESKRRYVLLHILVRLCMIIVDIMGKNNLVVNVYMLSVQRRY